MQKKTLYSWILISTLCLCFQAFWAENEENSCEYQSQLEQCIIANKNGSARSIADFACLQSSSSEAILDQIILDVKFREIQEEKYDFLQQLKQDKEAILTDRNRVIDDIEKNFALEQFYHTKYKAVCNGWILAERAKCGSVPITTAGRRVIDNSLSSECMTLAKTHLNIYYQVAYDVVKLNKAQVLQDQYKQDIVQVMRGKFDELLSMMADIIWFMWRLARGVTHWTWDPK